MDRCLLCRVGCWFLGFMVDDIPGGVLCGMLCDMLGGILAVMLDGVLRAGTSV